MASLVEVDAAVDEGQDPTAFIDLRLTLDRPLSRQELVHLRSHPRDFLRIRVALPEQHDDTTRIDRLALAPAELFTAFYRSHTGNEPDAGLVDLFLELADRR